MENKWKQWKEITREERFFTSVLFHEVSRNPDPFWNLLRQRFDLEVRSKVVDVGYEVCFFRDMAFYYGKKPPARSIAKQTFDLILTLSKGDLCLLEAKAQQGFSMKQICALRRAKAKIEKSHGATVHLAAIHSSCYTPKKSVAKPSESTLFGFASITWEEIASIPAYKQTQVYERANSIYGN